MSRWFSSFKKWIYGHRGAIACVAVLGCFSLIGVAHADDSAVDAITATAANAITSPFGTLVSIIPMLIVTVLAAIIWVLGKLIIIVIGMVIIPILGYNNFAHSNIISIGWPLVRDVVNMMFILYLLYIAIRTIIGLEKSWQDQIVKLFIAAVGVNFSRTICLLIIDFGQVVMFTFVDAIRDIAAGNFINLFQISSFQSLSQAAIDASGNAGFNAIGYLGASYAVVVFLSMVLAVMLLMAVIFIYRIVILWVLIIMSPIAFFLMAMGSGKAGEWKSKFTGAVLLGPSLAFFLWLSLAAASGGPIATSEQFDTTANAGTEGDFDFGIANEIFQIDKLLSLFMALVIIMVGFQVSSSYAQSLGGVAAEYVNGKTAQRWIKGAAAAPAALGYKGAKLAGSAAKAGGIELARQVDRRLIDKDGKSPFQHLGKDIITAGNKLRGGSNPLSKIAGGWAADQAGAFGTKMQKISEDSQHGAQEAAKKRVAAMGDDEKIGLKQAMAEGSMEDALKMTSRDNVSNLFEDHLKKKSQDDYKAAAKSRTIKELDAKLMASGTSLGLSGSALDGYVTAQKGTDAYKKDLADGEQKKIDEFNKKAIKHLDHHKDHLDDAQKKDLLKLKAQNLHLLGSDADMDKVLNDTDFNSQWISKASITDGAKGAQVMKALDRKTAGVDTVDGKPVARTVADFAESGRGVSSEVRDAVRDARKIGGRLADTDPKTGAYRVTTNDMQKAFEDGRMKVEDITAAQMTARSGDIVKAVIDAKVNIASVALPRDAAAAGQFSKAMEAHYIGARNVIPETGKKMEANDAKRGEIDGKILAATQSLEKAFGYRTAGHPTPGFTDPGKKRAGDSFSQGIRNDVTIINQIQGVPGGPAELRGDTAMRTALLDGPGALRLEDLQRAVGKAQTADPATRAAIKQALAHIEDIAAEAVRSARATAGGPPNPAATLKHDQLRKDANRLGLAL